uniref:Uncharacterized protein n=1 Tax=uncultured delta proteobacterium HF0070_07E19 TaxID=710823 RepID=E0XXB9_9DELT|nr:hypothetical protein [uncultured delta proteobacterium HF0070_07E19]
MDTAIYAFIGLGIMGGGALILAVITKFFLKSDSKAEQTNQAARTTSCRDCDGLVSKSAKKCPHCGADIPHLNKAGFGFLTFIRVIILFAIVFVGTLLFLFGLDLMELSNRLKY